MQAEVVTQEFGAQSVVNPLGEAFMSTVGETTMAISGDSHWVLYNKI